MCQMAAASQTWTALHYLCTGGLSLLLLGFEDDDD